MQPETLPLPPALVAEYLAAFRDQGVSSAELALPGGATLRVVFKMEMPPGPQDPWGEWREGDK